MSIRSLLCTFIAAASFGCAETVSTGVSVPESSALVLSGGNSSSALADAGTWRVLPAGVFAYAQGPVVVNDKLYAIGGFVARSVRRYDPVTNVWTTVAGLSQNVIQYFGLTVFDGKIWVLGGDSGGSGWRNILQVFDPATNAWSLRAPMLQGPRYALSGVVLNGKIYAIGGYGGPGGSTPLNWVEVYNPATNSWSVGVPLPTPRVGPWVGAINGKIYVAGGSDGVGATRSTLVFDPATNAWSSVADKPTAGGGDAFNVVVDGKLWVFSGTELHAYDPVTNSWSVYRGPPTARGAVGVAGDDVRRRIYTLGGWGGRYFNDFEVLELASTPPPDVVAPTIGAVTNLTAEATSASGAVVTFALPSATDAVDPAPAVSASAASGSTFSVGTTTVTVTAKDAAGNSSTKTFTVKVQDTTAPAIGSVPSMTLEATSAAGTRVSFALPSASDAVDPTLAVSANPASGSVFPLGSTTVLVSATDDAGNVSTTTFTVTVLDTTAPVIGAVSNLTVEATSAAGAVVTFALPSATDAVDPAPTVSASPASGSTFPVGMSTVTVTARDAAGNSSSKTFTVKVEDTTAPAIGSVPSMTLEATSAAGAVVSFALPPASDAVDPTPVVSASPASGRVFALGTTTVLVSATDDAGNVSSTTFTVTVLDTTAPVIGAVSNLTVEATSAAGAVVTFALPSAADAVDPAPTVSATPVSGSTFPIGTTTVTVTATDAAGNVSTATFTVTVEDTVAPVIGAVSNLTAEATSAAGAVVTFALPSVTDLVALATVSASPSSGSTFPIGVTTVTVTATDAAGNVSTATFTVSVQDTTDPVIGTVSNLTVDATSAAGAVVTFGLPAATDAVDPTPQVSATPASGSTFSIGSTTVTVTATDSHGNSSTATFSVTVLSPAQMASNLSAATTNLGFQQGTNLVEKALGNINSAATTQACNQLNAFINQVNAQTGKQLTLTQATLLIASAHHIRSAIGCN